jgi:hypothetical protein
MQAQYGRYQEFRQYRAKQGRMGRPCVKYEEYEYRTTNKCWNEWGHTNFDVVDGVVVHHHKELWD